MSKVLKIKHGAKSTMPTLAQAEMGFVTDSGAEELWIGNGAKNIEIARKDYVAAELTKKLDKTGGTIQDETGDYEATLLPTGLEVSDGINYADLSDSHLEFTEDSETPHTTTLDAYKLEFNHSYENDDTGETVNRVVGVVRGLAETTDETAAVPYGQMMERFSSVPTLKTGTAIPAGADLNTYITPGNYYCASTNTALELVNKPNKLSYAFTMQVSYATGTASYIRQDLVELNGIRHFRWYDSVSSKTFTDWNTEYSTANKPNIDSTPTSGSTNPVTSGGVYNAINNAIIGAIEGSY